MGCKESDIALGLTGGEHKCASHEIAPQVALSFKVGLTQHFASTPVRRVRQV